LKTLNLLLGDIADAKFDAASKLAEARLGMSSLPAHNAAALARYFPMPMQQAGTGLHHAASRLAIALEDASVTQTFDTMRKVDAALHDVTSACVACHAAYRLR
jgi:cytochrome c556